MPFELQVLGTLDLRHTEDGRRLDSVVVQPKRIALLVYLAISGEAGPVRRDSLLALFWAESSEPSARRALNQALYVLRRALGDGVVVSRGDHEIGIAEGRLRCDLLDFRRAIRSGDPALALAVYGGEFLPGFHIDNAPDFERWLETGRRAARDMAHQAAFALVDEEVASGSPAAAARWAREGMRIHPYDESGHRRLIALLDEIGDSAGALQEHAAFEDTLIRDLGIEPSAETRALAESIRVRAARHVGASTGVTDRDAPGELASSESPTTAPPPEPEVPPRPSWSTPSRATWSLVGLGVAASLVLFVALGSAIRGRSESLPDELAAPERPLVFVSDFRNETGDVSLDVVGRMAADWVIQGLSGSGLVDVLATRRFGGVGDTDENQIGRASPDGDGPSAVRGAYYASGDSLVFHVEVVDLSSGTIEGTVGPIAAPTRDPLRALTPARDRLAGLLGIHYTDRLGDAEWLSNRSPTFDAYATYIEGLDHVAALDNPAAVLAFLDAWKLDTTFLAPVLDAADILAVSPMPLRDFPRADSLIDLLESRRTMLSPAARHHLDALSASARGDLEARYSAYERAFQLAPLKYAERFVELAQAAGRYGVALAALDRVSNRRELVGGYWFHRIWSLHMLGRHDEEELVPEEMERAGEDVSLYWRIPALVALGRDDMLEQVFREGATESAGRARMGALMAVAAGEMFAHGRVEDGRTLASRSADIFDELIASDSTRNPMRYPEVLIRAGRFEDAIRAYERAESFLLADPGYRRGRARVGEDSLRAPVEVQGGHAEAVAHTGRIAEAREMAARLPPLYRARVEAALGNREEALVLVREYLSGGGSRMYLHYGGHGALESLRGDPEFEELVRPGGLETAVPPAR